MSLHSDTLSWFQANQFWLLLLKAVCFAKKQQIPIFLIFSSTRGPTFIVGSSPLVVSVLVSSVVYCGFKPSSCSVLVSSVVYCVLYCQMSYILARKKLHFNEMMVMSALYETNMHSWIFIVLAHWNNRIWISKAIVNFVDIGGIVYTITI
jgi:hypothetical protein